MSRLQRALQESSLSSFPAPPDPSSITAADTVPSWGADPSLLSPLLEAYDRRLAEADRVNERIKLELSSLQARSRQLSLENDRLSGEVRHLTEAAIARLEERGSGEGGLSLEAEERATLLASENEAYAEENAQMRAALSAAQAEIAALSQQLSDKDSQNSILRAKIVSSELRDAEANATKEVFGAADSRNNMPPDPRVSDELEAVQRELRVANSELASTRNDLRAQVKACGELRATTDGLSKQLAAERAQQSKEHEENRAKELQRINALSQAKQELEELKSRRADEQAYVEELKKQIEDVDRLARANEQKLAETRAREDLLKGQCRRLEEAADEAQLASDQAQALEEQARREIGRLSDKLRQVLVEAQARSEETVMSIRQKYKGQKAQLQEQVTQLEIRQSELRTENDRVMRDNASLQAEMEKLLRDGPGGNVGRLQREIDDLNRRWREASAERDTAVHSAKATELSSRRQQANWEQEHLQAQEQIVGLQRQLKRAEERGRELGESAREALAESQALSRRERGSKEAMERMEAGFEERMKAFTAQCREQLSEMEEKVRKAELSEEEARNELQELLDAHDQLQGKWREASKEVAVQSQRYIEELRVEKARLEARNKELNSKLATVLVDQAGTTSMHDQHERQMARLRVLFDAGEKRNAECKQQIADLLRSEAALMEERKEAVFKAEKSSMELERATKALDEARETIKQLRSREWGASSSHAGAGS